MRRVLSRERREVHICMCMCICAFDANSISFIKYIFQHTFISSLGSSFLICTTPLATFGGTTPAAPAETLASREFDGEVLADIVNWVGSKCDCDGDCDWIQQAETREKRPRIRTATGGILYMEYLLYHNTELESCSQTYWNFL